MTFIYRISFNIPLSNLSLVWTSIIANMSLPLVINWLKQQWQKIAAFVQFTKILILVCLVLLTLIPRQSFFCFTCVILTMLAFWIAVHTQYSLQDYDCLINWMYDWFHTFYALYFPLSSVMIWKQRLIVVHCPLCHWSLVVHLNIYDWNHLKRV